MTDQPIAAAADLDIGAPAPQAQQPPMNLPAPPAGFVNPGSLGYVDQQGNLRAMLSSEQLATARKDWLDVFDRGARDAWRDGGDPSAYGPEARTAWAAKFDQAALQDNHAPVEPVSPQEIMRREQHGLPGNTPTPADYKPLYGQFLADKGTEHLARFDAEVRQWAAHVGLEANLGKAMIERMVELAPKLRVMEPEGRTRWIDQNEQTLLQRAGSAEALAAMREAAKAVLRPGENKLSAAIADSFLLSDPWILLSLANHSRAVASYYGRK
jgi:hypothetical protein